MAKPQRLVVALRLAEQHGLRLFPLRRNSKLPSLKGWQDAATTDAETLTKWFGKGERNIGVYADASGLVVIDTDQKHAGIDGDANLRALAGLHAADLDSTFTTESPTGSRHYYFRGDLVASKSSVLAMGVDVKSKGGLVVAPGSEIDGKPYRVVRNVAIQPVPQWLTDAISRAYTAKADKVKLEAPVELDTDASLAHALAYLADAPASVEGQGGNDNAYRVACRLKDIGVSEGLALDLMDLMSDWNSRCSPPWERDELEEVVGHAYSYGENSPGSASVELDFDILPDDEPEPEPTLADLGILFDAEIDNSAVNRRRYIIKGVLAEGDIATIFGPPGAGKSLIAPYLGHRVSRGEPAFGRRTKQRGVLYVAAEDEAGMSQRIKALHTVYGQTEGFGLPTNISDLAVKGSKDLKRLLAAAKVLRPGIIFIDTVAMAFPNIDENTAEGMGLVVNVGRRLAKASGGAVVFIHHDTKAAGDTPRGHSVFNGALDMRLKVTRDERTGIISGKLGKNRNGSLDWEPAFRIGINEIGQDEDGDPITVAYAKEVEHRDTGPRTALPAASKGALAILTDMGGEDGVAQDDWRDACCDGTSAMSGSEDMKNRRKTFSRVLQDLFQRKLIVREGDKIRLAGASADFDVIEDGPFPDDS